MARRSHKQSSITFDDTAANTSITFSAANGAISTGNVHAYYYHRYVFPKPQAGM